ncbi:MAG: sialidase family protein, partial [Phycisphaerae bacterium]
MNASNATAANVFLLVKQRLSLPGATVVALASGMFFAGAASTSYGQWPPVITYPEPLNTNAASDTGWDWRPQLTTDGAGNWVAVWESYENLGGTIGTDYDILFSRSIDNGANWSPPAALNTNAASDSGGDRFPQLTTDEAGN